MTDFSEGLTLFVNEVPPKKGTFRMKIRDFLWMNVRQTCEP
jgi:hypothetical protein